MKEYYELLGLTESATDDEILAKYEELRAKYKEDRWLDGEAGNEAAKLLTKLEVAYTEIMASRREQSKNTEGQDAFEEIAELIKNDKLTEAQARLDNFNERNAEWHYYQAGVYYRKQWMNDSKKQLEIAMEMDPDNQKYRAEYGKLNHREEKKQQQSSGQQQQQSQNPYSNRPLDDEDMQMGGSVCSNCVSCCYTYLCVDCLFSLCCGCR